MNIDELEIRWRNLFASLCDVKTITLKFSEVRAKYDENGRYYHTISHINSCLELIDKVQNKLTNKLSVELAIWYHDVIYNPKSDDNEERSAEYARRHLSQTNLEREAILDITDLIMVTKHPSHPKTNDEKYLVDIDLSILGSNESEYDKYASSIRKEYAHVPNFMYKIGRKKILKSLLTEEFIFNTEYFREKLDVQARQNISRELEML